ncbi:hypothetical protein AAur_pTC10280 (plasmid) [Paenarthrobacter aurescens TC1]|jgi:hypothetical protein|uniref:Uncharacterized protein n=1 Tax=Paenarthrobacter aurescens (strain TC1) TaxID=290340 RepID=A1RD37_PAEAT|nr:hypothetical protein AAur_pTC10280 [Paenarthrobacter aurescens TC1]
MNQSPKAGPAGPHPRPVVVLRDQLTQAMTATSRLRSILAGVDNPGRRPGERR